MALWREVYANTNSICVPNGLPHDNRRMATHKLLYSMTCVRTLRAIGRNMMHYGGARHIRVPKNGNEPWQSAGGARLAGAAVRGVAIWGETAHEDHCQ